MFLQAQPRFHWFCWLSVMALQAFLSSAKTVAGPQLTPSAFYYGNDGGTRKLRSTGMDPLTEKADVDEDRSGAGLSNTVLEGLETMGRQFPVAHDLYETMMNKVSNTELLKSDKYTAWKKEVTKHYNNNHEMAAAAIIETLAANVGSVDLRKMLSVAKEIPSKKDDVPLLEEAMIQIWLGKGETARNVFKWLKLGAEGRDILSNPFYSLWVAYFNRLHPNVNVYPLLVQEARMQYGENKFASFLIQMLRKYTEDMSIARDPVIAVVRQKLYTWLLHNKTPDDVYKLLELDKEPAPLLCPALDMWALYVHCLKLDPNPLMFAKLQTLYTDEKSLAKAIVAYETTIREDLESIEGTLVEHLLYHWRSKHYNDLVVYDILEVYTKYSPAGRVYGCYKMYLDGLSKMSQH